MKYTVKKPFVLDNKTYLPEQIVPDTTFSGHEAILKNFVNMKYIIPIGKKAEPTPEPEKKPVATSIEFKTDRELQGIIEGKKEPKPETEEKLTETPIKPPTKQRGQANRK